MLKFNENTMTKASVKVPFSLDNENVCSGVFSTKDGQLTENIKIKGGGEECWFFSDNICDMCDGNKRVFIYFPKVDYATTISVNLINTDQ